jgi:LysR family transcriptional regulator for metE and metH
VDLEVRHFRLVAAVAEHHSLTKAGNALNLSQSALSHQLRDIEERLGSRLFHRLNKRMVPTPAGERLIESARTVLAEIDDAERAIRGGLEERPILLRFSTECYTSYHWLPSVLKPFQTRFPNVDVRIDPESTNDPIGRLLDGKIDLAMVTSSVKHPRLALLPLFEDEQVLITAPDHPLAKQPFVRPKDFRRERLFTYSAPEESYFVMRVLRPAGVLPARVEPVQLTEAAIELVRAGLGVAVLSRWAVEPFARRGALRMVRITANGYFKHWRAAVPAHLAEAEHIKAFTELIFSHAPARQVESAVLKFDPPARSAREDRFASNH